MAIENIYKAFEENEIEYISSIKKIYELIKNDIIKNTNLDLDYEKEKEKEKEKEIHFECFENIYFSILCNRKFCYS